jgi:hypothetical protein
MSSKVLEKLEEAKRKITIVQAKLAKALYWEDAKKKDELILEALELLGGKHGKTKN